MVYELILTDKCNRKCKFCQISKGNHNASKKDIISFCNFVNHNNQNSKVNLFGGEPLLNIKGIDLCFQYLNPSLSVTLYTNGDELLKLINKPYINSLNIQVTTYDIFEDVEKYRKLCNSFNNIIFTFTFDETNIDKIEEYKNICRNDLNNNYKFALSHSNDSWINIDNITLYNKIYEITKQEIYDSIYSHKLSRFIEPKIKRLYELKHNPNIKPYTCLSEGKMTFYDGRFLNVPCILYKNDCSNPKNKYEKCINCKFNLICNKSCSFECVDGEVPEKLCIIEKAQFDCCSIFCK